MKKILNRFFIEGFNGMAQGLFATLIIGTALQQAGTFAGGSFGSLLVGFGKTAAALTGAGIGVGIACRLGENTLTVLSAAVSGMVGAFAQEISAGTVFTENGSLVLSGAGEPLIAFLAAFAAIELSRLTARKTKMDMILCPLCGILGGSLAGLWAAPPVSTLMNRFREWISLSSGFLS